MDELTRFAQRLVEQLGASREGVHRPVEVAALRETVLPYRTHRRALGIDSVEDYETILLRLVSEERGYVKTMPADAAKRCREELAQSNPDLAVLDELSAATVQITSMAAQISGDGGDGEAGRTGGRAVEEEKPTSPAKAEKPARKAVPSAGPPDRPAAPSAPSSPPPPSVCTHDVPSGRVAVFCPWCGKRLIPFTCARCNTELDSEWKHCITCGAPVKDPFGYP